MLIIKQSGYDEFSCIADKCPESCCKCWQIMIDDVSMQRYVSLAKTDPKVKAGLNTKEKSFRQHDRICAFLDKDELCYLQKTYGEDCLCDTCRNYPRHVEEFENVREYSLSLSCPDAAGTLLNDPSPMSFEEEWTKEEEEFEEFDVLFFDKLVDARKYLFEIAQNRNLNLKERLSRIALFGFRLQKLVDEERLFEIDTLIENCRNDPEIKSNDETPGFRSEYLSDPDSVKRNFSILFELETLHTDWTDLLNEVWNTFFSTSLSTETAGLYDRFLSENETAGEQILMLFLYTYFCGSVYDGWVLSKTLLSVYSVDWIFRIAFTLGATKETLVKAAYRYAREIEHSDLNLNQLEEWFMDLI